jgi:hypothetical protein
MPIIKAQSDIKQRIKIQKEKDLFVSEEAQNRLAAILADSPTIEKLAGTEWEMGPLRVGTQYLIADEVRKIREVDDANYENSILFLANSVPVTCRCITFALLNDKNRIYQNGDPNQGFSKLFQKTYNTILWNTEKSDLIKILTDCLMMIDVNFFMEALGMLQIFRASVTEKKRTRKKTAGQK